MSHAALSAGPFLQCPTFLAGGRPGLLFSEQTQITGSIHEFGAVHQEHKKHHSHMTKNAMIHCQVEETMERGRGEREGGEGGGGGVGKAHATSRHLEQQCQTPARA